jgi:tetratricopeptide (TPR) repeat protein
VDGFRKAVEQFDHAIEIQPDYGAAYAGLAHAYAGLSTFAIEPKEAMPRVRAAADRAITFDPDLSEGYAARAMVEAFYDWNWNAAEADFKRAIALAPGDAPARLDYGYMLVVTGRFKEATEQLARAHELDPLSSFIASVQLWPLYEGRRYDEAIRAAQEVISVDSTAWNAHQVLGQAYFQKGEFAKSFEAGARAGVQRGLDTTNFFGEYYAAVGAPSITRQKLARLLKEGKEPWMIASLYAALGEKEQALNWLEKEIDRRNEAIVFLKVDPAWDTFRSEPRFHALLRRMNLER